MALELQCRRLLECISTPVVFCSRLHFDAIDCPSLIRFRSETRSRVSRPLAAHFSHSAISTALPDAVPCVHTCSPVLALIDQLTWLELVNFSLPIFDCGNIGRWLTSRTAISHWALFLPRDAMHKSGLCSRAVSGLMAVCPSVCLSVCHVRIGQNK